MAPFSAVDSNLPYVTGMLETGKVTLTLTLSLPLPLTLTLTKA